MELLLLDSYYFHLYLIVDEDARNKLLSEVDSLKKFTEFEKFLDSLLIEFYQFNEEDKTINYYRLIEKLSKMKYLRFSYFRPLIFECMNLIDKIGD